MRKQKRKRALTKTTKKNDTKPRSVGRGHKHLGVCCLQVFFVFFQAFRLPARHWSRDSYSSLAACRGSQTRKCQVDAGRSSRSDNTVVEGKVSGRLVHLWCTVQRYDDSSEVSKCSLSQCSRQRAQSLKFQQDDVSCKASRPLQETSFLV